MPIEFVEGFEGCVCHNTRLVNLYKCKIGKGTKIGAFVEIGVADIGENCKIQTGAFIPYGVTIGDRVFIGPNVTFCNVKHPDLSKEPEFSQIAVGNNAAIGAGSTILPGVAIGEGAVIGAGSVVTKDVPAGATAYGNPARVVVGEEGE